MRVIFAGTPDFAVPPLEKLIESHDVVAVFTQPDRQSGRGKKITPPPVKTAAIAHGVDVHQPLSLKDQVQIIENLNADVMVVVAYGMLLPQTILDIPRLGCINIHASILPRWRGAAPIQRAIEAGDNETGVSIMQMEAGLDTGPVFQVLKTPIKADDTSSSLHDLLSKLGAQGIGETLSKLAEDPNLKPVPQDDSQANYARKINKAEADIDWQLSANELDCKVRAFNPWPICQTKHNGEYRLRLWQARANDMPHNSSPGTVLDINDDGIFVACGKGTLIIKTLQKDGGKPLNHRQFLNGFAISVNDILS